MSDDRWFKRWGKLTPLGPWAYADIEEMMREMESAFLDAQSEMSKEAAEEGEASRDALSEEHGYSMSVAPEAKPVASESGAVRRGPPKQWVESISALREPRVEVVDSERELRVLAQLPGARKQDVEVSVRGNELVISAKTPSRKYRKRLGLPSPVSMAGATSELNNGVLDLRLPKYEGGSRAANAAG